MNEFIARFVSLVQSYGVLGLVIVAFAESSFFPIPPDVLLIPMSFVNRNLALYYALLTTLSSVLGGVLGHIIGKKFGKPILKKFFKDSKIQKVENYFAKYGGWAIAIAGFTPIPYKLFTISAGVFNVKISTLIFSSIIGRGARFFLEGIFIFFFGDTAKYILQNYFEALTIGITAVCIAFYFLWKWLKSKGKVERTGIVERMSKRLNAAYKSLIKYRKYDEAIIYFLIGIFLSLIALFVFLEIIEDYLGVGSWKFDTAAFEYFKSLRNPSLNSIVIAITTTGNFNATAAITLIVSFIFAYKRKKHESLFLMLNILGIWSFNEILKRIFKRPRPFGDWLVEATGYSFPSGHAMISMGFAIILIYFIINYIRNKKAGTVLSLIIFAYTLLIGLSRVYLGVHYLSDVLAGWLAASLWSLSTITVYRIITKRHAYMDNR